MDQYATSLARIVVLQVAHARGLKSIQFSSVKILADLLSKFIIDLGVRSSKEVSDESTDTITPKHIITVLTDIGLSPIDLLRHLSMYDDIPFAIEIPQFPNPTSEFIEASFKPSALPSSYVPSFLPPIPSDAYLLDPRDDSVCMLEPTEVDDGSKGEKMTCGEGQEITKPTLFHV
ncbi:hypothetical protein P9112_011541 [Eukaryota sp. TZLM1-RC]